MPRRIEHGLAIAGACAWLSGAAAAGPEPKRLWVLQAPDEIVEYDATMCVPARVLKVPAQALKRPAGLAVNGRGEMLFSPEPAAEPGATDELWIWNGRAAQRLARGSIREATRLGPNLSVAEATPQPFLSANGGLLWLANHFSRLERGDGAAELSVTTTVRLWRTNLAGARPEPVAQLALPACTCATSVCSETCPQATLWAPERGVDDFFVLTRWIPGQIGASFESSSLYRNLAGGWSARALPRPIAVVLDAARQGAVLVEAVPDAACCGWDNEGNDQTLLHRNGKSVLLFDEFERYGNADYDVSFYTSSVKLSPSLRFAGLTIRAGAGPDAEIRLSAEGKPNLEALARIKRALRELPALEVLALDGSPKRIALLPHAAMVGWLDDERLLILEDHVLVVLDVSSGARRRSAIRVSDEALVFLR